MKMSVVIPTYNDEGTIAATVKSALAQQFTDGFEVIVVNDGSTDNTRAELEKFGARIRVIDQANAGVAAARNTGIAAATGEYIALLDGDDTWSGKILQKTATLLDKNSSCVAALTNGMEVDDDGRVINPSYVEPGYDHAPTLDEMLAGQPWPILVGSMIIRRDTLVAVGGFPLEFRREHWGGEDTFVFLLVRERGEFIYVPEVLVRHRLRDARAHYANRLQSRRFQIGSAQAFREFEERFGGAFTFARLVREHFGARGRKVADWTIGRTAKELVTVGLMAMDDGDRALARRCYIASIRYRPSSVKTYFRLGWAMLPGQLSNLIRPLLAPGIRRSLSGPPFSNLHD
jgi:glycosyltransferase involved in cell wall biosynthesis